MPMIDKNTVALLHFDDASNILKDEIGKFSWVSYGTLGLADGKFNDALLLDASSEKYIYTDKNYSILDMSPGNDFTVDFWFSCITTRLNLLFSSTKNVMIGANDRDITSLVDTNGKLIVSVYSNSTGNVSYTSDFTLDTGVFYHIAFVSMNNRISVFLNGKLLTTFVRDVDIMPGILCFGMDAYTHLISDIVFDELRISNVARWTSNFVPPSSKYSYARNAYVKDNLVYGISNSVFQQLTSDYSSMSDVEKIALFSTITEDASISDLSTLNRFKIVSYSEDTVPLSCVLSAVPKDQLVLPNSLISIKGMSEVLSIKITEEKTASTDSDIKYAFTTDLTVYKAYNPVTLQWDIVNVDNLSSEGMSASTILGLSQDNIADFLGDSKGIGIGFVMYSTSVSNTISIDNLAITANMTGSWDKAVFGTDYKYGYPANDRLSVTLLSSGDYKINYSGA